MISVAIMINGNPIIARSAVNKMETNKDGQIRYACDDGSNIWHYPQDGAVVLAKKMLDTIREEK
jgi:hypothetical protein